MNLAQQAATSIQQQTRAVQRNAAALTQIMLSTASENVTAAVQFGQRLWQAKSLAEVARLQSEYLNDRVQAYIGRAGQLWPEGPSRPDGDDSKSATNEALESHYAELSGTAVAPVTLVDPATATVPPIDNIIPVKPLPDKASGKGRVARKGPQPG
jgi:Phasin protein